jgi:hypothetical protein
MNVPSLTCSWICPSFRHLDAAIGNRDVREWLGHPEAAGMSGEPRPILGRADATSGADHDVAALGEDVDRRGFTGMAAGLLASATIPLVQAPARVDAAQVRYLQATVEQLRMQDQSRGGGAILRLSLHQFARARRMVNESDYTETVGRQLLAAASALGIRAGWAAFDHGDQQLARFLYGEAQLLAASGTRPAPRCWRIAGSDHPGAPGTRPRSVDRRPPLVHLRHRTGDQRA